LNTLKPQPPFVSMKPIGATNEALKEAA